MDYDEVKKQLIDETIGDAFKNIPSYSVSSHDVVEATCIVTDSIETAIQICNIRYKGIKKRVMIGELVCAILAKYLVECRKLDQKTANNVAYYAFAGSLDEEFLKEFEDKDMVSRAGWKVHVVSSLFRTLDEVVDNKNSLETANKVANKIASLKKTLGHLLGDDDDEDEDEDEAPKKDINFDNVKDLDDLRDILKDTLEKRGK